MAQVVLGCDSNGVDDANYQSTVASILEKAGHTVEKCAIQSNAFASYSDGSNGKNPKGKIGIYLIAPGTYSIADATYGTSKFKYNYLVLDLNVLRVVGLLKILTPNQLVQTLIVQVLYVQRLQVTVLKKLMKL